MSLKITALTAFLTLFSIFISYSAMATPPAKAFGELPIGYDAAISPDGQHLAIVMNIKGSYGVLSVKTAERSEKPWFLPLGEGIKPGFVKWVNNERFVVSIAKSDSYLGTPFTSRFLFAGNIKTRDGDIVVKPKKIFRQFNDRVIDWLEDDPEHILMAYSDEQFDPYPDIKKVHVVTGRGKTVKRGKAGIEYWIADDDGMPRVGAGATDRGTKRMIVYNSVTDKWDSSDDYPGLEPDTDIYGILKDGTELVIGNYKGRDTLGLYIYDLGQKRITRTLFHNDEYDASGVILSKDGETVIGAKYTADSDKVELLGEYGTLLDRLRDKYSDYDVDFVDQTQNGKTVLVKMSSPYDPGALMIYNAGEPTPRRLTKMYNGFDIADMGEVISVKYTARDGQKIPAFVTLPPMVTSSPKNLPFIVLPHGGPYARDAKRFDYFAQFFATRGYGVLQMNFRGSEGYGKSFAEAGRSNWIVMQEDVEDGMRWLLKKGYADPDRTCIAGWSYGGYAALMGVATDPELYKCAIAMAALTDINDARRDLKKYRGGKQAAKSFFGEALQDSALRKANSPVHVADQIKVPVFLAHGDKDENVQFDQYTRMKKSLKKADVKTTALAFKDEDHYLSQQKNREAFFVAMDKFLTEVNGKSEFAK